ncbi:ROK family transcriptional regulator [Microtetraspora malaysiensis]|uniref:ROK family transcriptional regulator n=1 Tax=Microtetraspora malaysiensis TaxID=161358 RepID=UPI0014713A8E|nr:ROK family transcriptional regulator [Microtetraspora malaysiensis]
MTTETDATLRGLLRHLIDFGPLSRPELGEGVGLARATTSSLVNDLMRRGLVGEIPTPPQGRRGRPTTLLDVDDDRYASLGLEIGLDRILVAAYTPRGGQLLRVERPAEPEPGNPRALLRVAAGALREVADSVAATGRIPLGAGVCVPGLVDASSGTVKYVPSLGWHDVALRAGVADALGGAALGGSVLVDSDANYAALAERRARLRDGAAGTSLVYLTGTYGISAGIITGDRLWRGARGLAGDVGHIMLDPGGKRCVCGRSGCFETRAGLAGIVRTALAGHRRRGPARSLADAVEETVRLAQRGDSTVLDALAEAGRWLGRGAAVVSALLDPGAVVLGGHYARLAPWMLDPAREAYAAAVLTPGGEAPGLEVSMLGPWGPVEGAALSVLLALTEGSLPLPDPVS